MKKMVAIQIIIPALFFYFSLFIYAEASVFINEIMYDAEGSDDGMEWIEVYNDSDTGIDLTTYKLFEGDTNHKIISYVGGANLDAKSYAVISSNPEKFKNTTTNFIGLVFKSSFTLNNTGEQLVIKDKDLKNINEYTYNSSFGGAGDGNSLQKIESDWKSSKPTPGQENKIVEVKKVVNKIKKEIKKESPPPSLPLVKEEEKESFVPENLEAQVIGANYNSDRKEESNLYFYIVGAGMLVVVLSGVWLVSFVRKKGVDLKEGDDFEIFEE